MEIVFKLVITALVACLIYYQLAFLRGVWRSQLDPKVTITRLLDKLKPKDDLIATRDPTKIYQAGIPVGEVFGGAVAAGDRMIFKQLVNTTGLDRDAPFEFQRRRLQIVGVGSWTGMLTNATDKGTFVYKDVLENVVCQVVEQP